MAAIFNSIRKSSHVSFLGPTPWVCWSKYSKEYHEIQSHISIYQGVPPVCFRTFGDLHISCLHHEQWPPFVCSTFSKQMERLSLFFSGKSRWTILFESYYNIQISKLYIDNWKSPTYFTFWLWRDWTETLSLHASSTSRSRVGWSGCNATIFPWFRCDELWSSLEWKWGNGGRNQTVVHGMKLQAW